MSEIERVVNQFRADLLARERRASVQMVAAYADAYQALERALEHLTLQMEVAKATGEEVTQSWLQREKRLKTLLDQVDTQMQYFARNTSERIAQEQAAAVMAAQDHAQQLALFSLNESTFGVSGQWNRVPTEALTDLVGVMGDGSPLVDYLLDIAPASVDMVRKALVIGVAMGKSPRAIAPGIREAMGGNLTRALTIARTETLRAYRSSSLRAYKENADVVTGWVWLAALSGRTCPACLAMHGTFHDVDEPFGSHPNCRCSPAPIVSGSAPVESGEAWLKGQSEDLQNEVLGQAAGKAWRGGEVVLADFLRVEESANWGVTRSTRSLQEARLAASIRESRTKTVARP